MHGRQNRSASQSFIPALILQHHVFRASSRALYTASGQLPNRLACIIRNTSCHSIVWDRSGWSKVMVADGTGQDRAGLPSFPRRYASQPRRVRSLPKVKGGGALINIEKPLLASPSYRHSVQFPVPVHAFIGLHVDFRPQEFGLSVPRNKVPSMLGVAGRLGTSTQHGNMDASLVCVVTRAKLLARKGRFYIYKNSFGALPLIHRFLGNQFLPLPLSLILAHGVLIANKFCLISTALQISPTNLGRLLSSSNTTKTTGPRCK